MKENTVILNKLIVGYTHNRLQKPVMGVIDAALGKGELVALVGGNGAGKSTLLRTLSAFQEPLSGSITYPDGKKHKRQASELATQIAVVLTGNSGIHSLTVREVVAMGRVPYTGLLGRERRKDEEAIVAAMNAVGVEHLAERRIETLSDGERQKAMIAKALAQDTPVIMLDEPTAFLDFGSRVQLFKLLQELAHKKGKSILVSTHDLELVLQIVDRLWLIYDGKMYTGTVEALTATGVLSSFIETEGIHYNKKEKRIEII